MTKPEKEPLQESPAISLKNAEIRIPHAPDAGPVTAVKSGLLQASLAQLKAKGVYEGYSALVHPSIPEQILNSLAMSWLPLEVALAHYRACEGLMLSAEKAAEVAAGVGDRVQETTLVGAARKTGESGAKVEPDLRALHRMWARLYQGGSIQVARPGPKQLLVQHRGLVLTQFRYFRQGLVGVSRAQFEAVGVHIITLRVESYSPSRDELNVFISWE
jgi:hypothetical protein